MSETETIHIKPDTKVDSTEERKQRKRDKAKEYYQRKKEAKLIEKVTQKIEAPSIIIPDKPDEKISELVKEIVKKRQPRKPKNN